MNNETENEIIEIDGLNEADESVDAEKTDERTVFVAINGRANVGKSSLLNLLIGEKIAIVSNKPQTTRTRINGVLTKDGLQYVFIDTPGMHRAKNKLSAEMVKAIRSSSADVDVVLLMVDVTKKISPIETELIRGYRGNGMDVILLLNKVDLLKDKQQILKAITEYKDLYDFADIIPMSVRAKENTDVILSAVAKFSTDAPHYFPDDVSTDQPEKIWLSEVVREKLLRNMNEEIPHGIAVQIETLEETQTNKGEAIVDMSVVIICEKASHKGMVIGKGGEMLKTIGSLARAEMEEYFGCKVNMKLWVKVKEDWRNRESFIAELGLEAE